MLFLVWKWFSEYVCVLSGIVLLKAFITLLRLRCQIQFHSWLDNFMERTSQPHKKDRSIDLSIYLYIPTNSSRCALLKKYKTISFISEMMTTTTTTTQRPRRYDDNLRNIISIIIRHIVSSPILQSRQSAVAIYSATKMMFCCYLVVHHNDYLIFSLQQQQQS